MDKVCILGVDGFTGSHLLEYIQKHALVEKYAFFGFSRTPSPSVIPITSLVATDRHALATALESVQPNYIINLIGSPQPPTLESSLALNATISQWACEIVIEKKLPLKKFLAIGSAAEYGFPEGLPIQETQTLRPISIYGLAKSWQTNVLTYFHRTHGIPIVIARTFNIIGERMPAYLSIGSFAQQIRQSSGNGVLHVGNLESKRDFLTIDDVVDAYWKILLDAPAGEVYNVCSGQSVSMELILKTMITGSGKSITLQLDSSRIKKNDVRDIFGDNKKLISNTSWTPKNNIHQTLVRLVQSNF